MCSCKKMSWLSRLTMLLFSVLGLWYTIKPFGVPTYGEFWHWVTLLFGIYIMIYSANQSHEQTVRFARWIGVVIFLVGGWFLVGEYCMRFMPRPLSLLAQKGSVGSWVVVILGCWMILSRRFRRCAHPLWYSSTFTLTGIWFLLGSLGYAPTFGINLLHLMIFIVPIGIMVCCSSCKKEIISLPSQMTSRKDADTIHDDTVKHFSDEDKWENL